MFWLFLSNVPEALWRRPPAWPVSLLMAGGRADGRPRNPLDVVVAAVAEVNDCILVTDNERDFAGLKVVNPMSRT